VLVFFKSKLGKYFTRIPVQFTGNYCTAMQAIWCVKFYNMPKSGNDTRVADPMAIAPLTVTGPENYFCPALAIRHHYDRHMAR